MRCFRGQAPHHPQALEVGMRMWKSTSTQVRMLRLAWANSTGWARGPCAFVHEPWGVQVRLGGVKKWKHTNYRTHPSKQSHKMYYKALRMGQEFELTMSGRGGEVQPLSGRYRQLWISITDNFQAFFYIKVTMYPLVFSANLFLNGNLF